ncbi:MAG: hypothetical protein SW833_01845 [Cyanobacteriota bacterium]|nr:hypothetical protein [Cyanobacteriota bacterium]
MLAKDKNIAFDRVVDLLEADPDDLFKTALIEERPEANFQSVALKRLQGDSWDKLAVEFRVAGTALQVFYRNCLQEFKPHFKKYLSLDNGWKQQLVNLT